MKILGQGETYIYCLIHNNDVKYIGKSDNPNQRFNNQLHKWDSIQDAVVGTGTNRASINYVLKGKRNQAGGYKWTYSNIY